MVKVTHRKMCQKLKLHHTTKWFMHKLESVLENETHKNLEDNEIQTDHLIMTRRPDLVIISKKNCIVNFAAPADLKVKIRVRKKETSTMTLSKNKESCGT